LLSFVIRIFSGSLLTYLFSDNNGTRQVFAVDLPKLAPLTSAKDISTVSYNLFAVEEPEVIIGE
jgi:hypothetical protein